MRDKVRGKVLDEKKKERKKFLFMYPLVRGARLEEGRGKEPFSSVLK